MSAELADYRSRRLEACRACSMLSSIIDHLGVEDGSTLPLTTIQGVNVMPAPSTEAQKRELQNLVALTLRMILLANDGQISSQELRRY